MSDEQTSAPVVLEPCPFCGGDAAHGHIRYPNGPLKGTEWEDGSKVNEAFFVNCVSCGASVGREGIVGGYQKPESAATAWNTRPQPSSDDAAHKIYLRSNWMTTLVCDAIWGGEHGWESATDEQFKDLMISAHKRLSQPSSDDAGLVSSLETLRRSLHRYGLPDDGPAEIIQALADAIAALSQSPNTKPDAFGGGGSPRQSDNGDKDCGNAVEAPTNTKEQIATTSDEVRELGGDMLKAAESNPETRAFTNAQIGKTLLSLQAENARLRERLEGDVREDDSNEWYSTSQLEDRVEAMKGSISGSCEGVLPYYSGSGCHGYPRAYGEGRGQPVWLRGGYVGPQANEYLTDAHDSVEEAVIAWNEKRFPELLAELEDEFGYEAYQKRKAALTQAGEG